MLWHDEWVFLSCLRCFCSNHFFVNMCGIFGSSELKLARCKVLAMCSRSKKTWCQAMMVWRSRRGNPKANHQTNSEFLSMFLVYIIYSCFLNQPGFQALLEPCHCAIAKHTLIPSKIVLGTSLSWWFLWTIEWWSLNLWWMQLLCRTSSTNISTVSRTYKFSQSLISMMQWLSSTWRLKSGTMTLLCHTVFPWGWGSILRASCWTLRHRTLCEGGGVLMFWSEKLD